MDMGFEKDMLGHLTAAGSSLVQAEMVVLTLKQIFWLVYMNCKKNRVSNLITFHFLLRLEQI